MVVNVGKQHLYGQLNVGEGDLFAEPEVPQAAEIARSRRTRSSAMKVRRSTGAMFFPSVAHSPMNHAVDERSCRMDGGAVWAAGPRSEGS
jgi:hypothetical protein